MFFFALKATNLSITADELQMTYFKCKSLRKVTIVVTARHFLVFLTLCSQLKFSENPGKNRLEPERILTELTHLTVRTNKFQIIIPTSLWFSDLNQLSV